MMMLLAWLAVLVTAVILYLRRLYSSFSRHGVKHWKPALIIGNNAKLMSGRQHVFDHILELYGSFPEERFIGKYDFIKELIIIRDLELVKKIAIKDFEHFLDHQSVLAPEDSFFSKNLFSLKGEEWKDMRSTLSPAFTSSKIRLMVPFMEEAGDHMMRMIRQKINESKDGSIELDCKDLTTRYANDVIATCAFGLKVDSQKDRDNSFYLIGKEVSNFDKLKLFKMMIISNAPVIAKLLKLDIIPESCKEALRNIVLSTMENREMNNIIRPDMIHLLMEARKGKLTHEDVKTNDVAAGFATVEESAVGKKVIDKVWTDDELVAQAVVFFIAGFESISTGMVFLLYELATNPDVQERLAQEIKETDAKNGGKFDFNSIQNMVYMDMVVSETIRLWPPGIVLDRICTKDYNMGKPNPQAEKDYILRKGTGIWIPIYAFHRDPEYFPNPDKFDPERFSEENRHTNNMSAYMPFGVGPRNCIGSRFALCEIKVMVYQILKEMVLSPSKRTCIPAKLSIGSFNLKLEGGDWIKFTPRN
ncbi:unnamed protein product [Spodoptera littoralis]|uniref:unspecific monooxygenase n=1 Tax=Spodoptera littoralis TaxID=7109 RepID=A0A9P0N7H6_SPOLI|nr:unnamed protein product [Spodoptera littoralis]CAH1645259.1 unnamed protein product [Spodoptera littoralis]